ncbi:MAG: CARDB domain-containing protein [Natronomonas sp.]
MAVVITVVVLGVCLSAANTAGAAEISDDSVVVNKSDEVATGESVALANISAGVVAQYDVNNVDREDAVVVASDNTVETEHGDVIVAENGTVEKIPGMEPDIRAILNDRTVERLVRNGSNIETESGVNIERAKGGNVVADPDAFDSSNFQVEIVDTNEVAEGEKLIVTGRIENRAHLDDTQTIRLLVDGSLAYSRSIELEPGESKTAEFNYTTTEGDAPEIEIELTSDDDSDSQDVPVHEADVLVDIGAETFDIVEGATLTVPVEVRKIGGDPDETNVYAIELYVHDEKQAKKIVTFEGAGTRNLEFDYETGSDDLPEFEVVVEGPNDANDTATVSVQPAIFAVDIIDAPESIHVGETVDITASVTNHAHTTQSQQIEVFTSNQTRPSELTRIDQTSIELVSSETTNVSFPYEAKTGDVPELSMEIRSDDDSDSTAISVKRRPEFEIVGGTGPELVVEPNASYSITVTVENTGSAEGTQSVTLRESDTVVESKDLTLNVGERETVTFTNTAPADGNTSIEIHTEFDVYTGTVTLNESGATPDPSPEPAEDPGRDQWLIGLGLLGVIAAVAIGSFLVLR